MTAGPWTIAACAEPVVWPFRRGWELRVGPVPGEDVARVIDEFVW